MYKRALATLNYLWVVAQRKEVWVGFTIEQLIPASPDAKSIKKLTSSPISSGDSLIKKSDTWYTLFPEVEKEVRKQNGGIPINGILVNIFAYFFKNV